MVVSPGIALCQAQLGQLRTLLGHILLANRVVVWCCGVFVCLTPSEQLAIIAAWRGYRFAAVIDSHPPASWVWL
jgi:hypothetical protein